MTNSLKGILLIGAISAGLIACTAQVRDDNSKLTHQRYAYESRPVSGADVQLFKRNPRHVYHYDGVKYGVRYQNNAYTYYHL